jgi:hypothetical protein
MVQLVTLQQAKDHLRRDTDDGDADLLISIKAASRAVLNYISDQSFLNSSGEPDYDSAGDPVGVPDPIQSAVLILVGNLDADRIGQEFTNPKASSDLARTGNNILPRTVHFLLDPYRSPVCE